MAKILLLSSGFDMEPLRRALVDNPELWDQNAARTESEDSPHHKLSDIWVRFAPEGSGGDIPHESEWKPAADALPVKDLLDQLMVAVGGKELGGVLITRIPPGEMCKPHIDDAWHAKRYEKFAFQVESAPGQAFCFEGDQLETRPGDLFWFDNAHTHWVLNPTDKERITLIACIRTDSMDSFKDAPLTDKELASAGVDIEHHFGGGAYIKRAVIPAGTELGQHAHEHDHLSVLMTGSVELDVDGESHALEAPQIITIKAGKTHKITAITDAIWLCVWGTDETDPAKVDQAILGG